MGDQPRPPFDEEPRTAGDLGDALGLTSEPDAEPESGPDPRSPAVGRRHGAVYRSGASVAVLSWDDYAASWSRSHGGYDLARATPVVRSWLRLGYTLAVAAAGTRLRPHAVTGAGLLLAVTVPVFANLRAGWPILAALLVVACAVADTVDGALATVTGRSSRLGYVLDSLADRVSEACWLVAFAVLGTAPWLVGLCGGLAWLHEYLRARAAVAGMPDIGTVTLAERPTRVLVAAFGLLFAGLGGLASAELAAGTVTVAAAIWVMLQLVAFAQLLAVVQRALR